MRRKEEEERRGLQSAVLGNGMLPPSHPNPARAMTQLLKYTRRVQCCHNEEDEDQLCVGGSHGGVGGTLHGTCSGRRPACGKVQIKVQLQDLEILKYTNERRLMSKIQLKQLK